jgi:hypothetical protein
VYCGDLPRLISRTVRIRGCAGVAGKVDCCGILSGYMCMSYPGAIYNVPVVKNISWSRTIFLV